MKCRIKVSTKNRIGQVLPPTKNGQVPHRDGSFQKPHEAKWRPCPGCDKCKPNGGLVLRKGSWRCTTASEYIFMFSKSRRYFCNGEPVAETAVGGTPGNKKHKGRDAFLAGDEFQRLKSGLADTGARETRNPRNVWTLSGEGTTLKHFAAYPTEIVKRILLAATSAEGCCSACMTPYAPIVESERVPTRPGTNSKVNRASVHEDSPYHVQNGSVVGNRDPNRHCTTTRIIGYRPACSCPNELPVPCRVLDPFAGTGTTLQVASWYGRDSIGCELNADYAKMAEQRIETMPRCMIREMKKRNRPVPNLKADEGLFAGLA